jgi:hypothetical protein
VRRFITARIQERKPDIPTYEVYELWTRFSLTTIW